MMAVDDDEMAAFDEETGLTESELPDQIDVATVLAAIAAGGAWEIDVSDATAVLGWRPSAVRAGWSPAAGDHPRVLHVHMADRLRSWSLRAVCR